MYKPRRQNLGYSVFPLPFVEIFTYTPSIIYNFHISIFGKVIQNPLLTQQNVRGILKLR